MSQNIPNEVLAVSMALFLSQEDSIHDYESNIITIKKRTSQWNSPIYQVIDKMKL